MTSYRKIDDVVWKNSAFAEKDPGKHARGRNLSMAGMAPTIDDLMESNELDDIIALAQKAANIRQSLGIFYTEFYCFIFMLPLILVVCEIMSFLLSPMRPLA